MGKTVPFQQNIKIIYFRRKDAYFAKKGAAAVGFLVESVSFLGFDVQNWMLIVTGMVAAFIFFVWRARDRI
jgi:hypothetical protein